MIFLGKLLCFWIAIAWSIGPGLGADLTYSRDRVDSLIHSGAARVHGAGIGHPGGEKTVYLWEESDEHSVFFILRNGVFFGEFRDIVLKNKKFQKTHETILIPGAADPAVLAKTARLRFVTKESVPKWDHGVVVGRTDRWWFSTNDQDGKSIYREETVVKHVKRSVLSVVVPDELTPDGESYFLGVERTNLTPHEKALGKNVTAIESFGLSNRRGSIWVDWPEDDPDLVVKLWKHTPKRPSPHDADPSMILTKEIGSMTISMVPQKNEPFVFIPSGK